MDINALFAVADAENGDFSTLIARLRNPEVQMEEIERTFLTRLLEGKSRGRPKMTRRELRKVASVQRTYLWLTLHDGYESQSEAAKRRTAELHGVAHNTVHNYLQRNQDHNGSLVDAFLRDEIVRAKKDHLSGEGLREVQKMAAPLTITK